MKSIIPVLTAINIRKSLAFYSEQLGFLIKEKYPDNSTILRVLLNMEDQALIIIAKDSIGIEADEFNYEMISNRPGTGIQFRFEIEEVDQYYELVLSYGVRVIRKPYNTPFPKGRHSTGMREFILRDPDGYFLVFASSLPKKSRECISCGVPVEHSKTTHLCHGCGDDLGHLLPFDRVLENTIKRLFMSMLGMDRIRAENAALEHLRHMPAWK